jgi:hypothetical protein
MDAPIKCFLLEPSGNVEQTVMAMGGDCPKSPYGHRAERVLSVAELPLGEEVKIALHSCEWPADFPMLCQYCGVDMAHGVVFSLSYGAARHWRDSKTGSERGCISEFGPGAMWRADWYGRSDGSGLYGWDWDNLREPPLHVHTPGGDWNIDSRASNCTLPKDRTHRCWVRTGEPPNVNVSKGGPGAHTCGAGAGSIRAGDYHGFLRNGYLVKA